MTVRDATPRLPVSLRSRPSACRRFLRPHTWCHDVYRVHEPVWGRSSREDGMPRPPSACACPGMVEHFDKWKRNLAIQFDPSNAFRSSSDATIGSHPIWIPMGIVHPRLQFVALQSQTFTIRLRGIKSALGATKTRKSAHVPFGNSHTRRPRAARESDASSGNARQTRRAFFFILTARRRRISRPKTTSTRPTTPRIDAGLHQGSRRVGGCRRLGRLRPQRGLPDAQERQKRHAVRGR